MELLFHFPSLSLMHCCIFSLCISPALFKTAEPVISPNKHESRAAAHRRETGPRWLMAENIPLLPACGFGNHFAAASCHCHRLISSVSPRHATVSRLPTSEQTPWERKTPTFQRGDRGMMSEGGLGEGEGEYTVLVPAPVLIFIFEV